MLTTTQRQNFAISSYNTGSAERPIHLFFLIRLLSHIPNVYVIPCLVDVVEQVTSGPRAASLDLVAADGWRAAFLSFRALVGYASQSG